MCLRPAQNIAPPKSTADTFRKNVPISKNRLSNTKKALSDLKVEISLAERRVKGLTSMVDNFRKAKAEKETLLSALECILQSHQGDTAAIVAEGKISIYLVSHV